ncbi:MAG: hypothetical protein ACLP1X_15095 [Polyangiaceae bacterium]
MDSLSDVSHSLSEAHTDESTDLLAGLEPREGDLIVSALYFHDRARALASVKPAPSTALAAPAAASPPMTLLDHFEALRPAHQIIVSAVVAAVIVASLGWVIGCLGTKAVGAAAAAI